MSMSGGGTAPLDAENLIHPVTGSRNILVMVQIGRRSGSLVGGSLAGSRLVGSFSWRLRRITQVGRYAPRGTLPLAKSCFDESGQISAGRIRSLANPFSRNARMTMFDVLWLSNNDSLTYKVFRGPP